MTTSTKQRTELSVIPKGHWRNKWHSLHPGGWQHSCSGIVVLDQFTYLSAVTYPSRELAEEYASAEVRKNTAPGGIWHHYRDYIRYLGPVFFPASKPDP